MSLTDLFSSFSSVFASSVNLDGTPMVGDSGVDIHGNPFGVTDSTWNSFSSSTISDTSMSSSLLEN